ncbi:hypothetical protein Hdeb2414_s0025g00661751 [Helianthus debilis subsp. tardiflorus]
MDFSYPTPNHVSIFVFKGHRFSLFSHLILLIFLHRFLVTSYMFLSFHISFLSLPTKLQYFSCEGPYSLGALRLKFLFLLPNLLIL